MNVVCFCNVLYGADTITFMCFVIVNHYPSFLIQHHADKARTGIFRPVNLVSFTVCVRLFVYYMVEGTHLFNAERNSTFSQVIHLQLTFGFHFVNANQTYVKNK